MMENGKEPQAPLTHSESYVKKTNRIILIVGISSLVIFLLGVILLITEDNNTYEYEEPSFTDNADVINVGSESPLLDNSIEFQTIEDIGIPITTTPNPVPLGQVVLGTKAQNVLTIGTNGKASIKIVSVLLAEPPAEGFNFDDGCSGKSLVGKDTCHITMSWEPVVAGNVQNNFIISWHETNVSSQNAKSEKVPVIGNAVTKEECSSCELQVGETSVGDGEIVKQAIGIDGRVIGSIDKDGLVHDNTTQKVIGRVNTNGLIVDDNGNIIGISDNQKVVLDENGNVIGYVNPDGTVVDKNGNVVGRVLPDGTVVDKDGNVIGRAVETGYVYDENGNVIGKVMPDGSVVDKNGNIIGRVNGRGEVVDLKGNVLGVVSKQGRVAVDKQGNKLGVVMPNGSIVNSSGKVVGHIDENGNVVRDKIIGMTGNKGTLAVAGGKVIGYVNDKKEVVDENGNVVAKVDNEGNVLQHKKIGTIGDKRRMAYDEQGNVIGYIQDDGTVVDFNGNVIGSVDEKGIIKDKNGKIIGKAGDAVDILYDDQGKVVGFAEGDKAFDLQGKDIGNVNEDGEV